VLEQALGALAQLSERHDTLERAVDLRLSLAPPLSALGDMERALAALRDAECAAIQLGDPRRLGWVWGTLATVEVLLGDTWPHSSTASGRLRVPGPRASSAFR